MQSVLIASRDAATREAIHAALDSREVRVVAEACGRWNAGELVRRLNPDAVVVGVSLLATREFFLTGWGPVSRDVHMIAVGPDDPHVAGLLLAHGVAAYVPVDRLTDELPGCLRDARSTALR
jgi:DNA-binding NarL/FixJ family response regulator